jgi:hypothetical protein
MHNSSYPLAWRRLIAALTLALPALFTVHSAVAAVPAFPGAQGFGANATGARGPSATVYFVTNLNDSGAGSFRDAVSQQNRYVLFRVGGIVNLASRVVVQPNVTIAGHTAPGDGITIYGDGLSYSNANNTVTRHIRYRMGIGGESGKDCITIASGNLMMFDHVSTSWGRDETFSISGTGSNITLQDCMIAMGLQTHSCGGLMETDGGVSIIRCLYIDNHTRNPKVKGKNEFVNNVVYNWGGGGGYIEGDSAGLSSVNVINNYFINGPQTSIEAFSRGNANFSIYASNNFQDSNRNGALDGAVLSQASYGPVTWKTSPYAYPMVSGLLTPQQAYAHIVANVGVTKPRRDRVDNRYIQELQSLGVLGQIPTNENDAPISGPGPVAGGTSPTDTDNDGMPNAWETANGTNPNVADHNGDANGNGYPNLEDYLNSLAGLTIPPGGGGGADTYQAESSALGGGAFVESTNGGFNGSGYINFPANGGSLQFNSVDGNGGGSKTIVIRYANGSSSRTGRLLINGVAQNITFAGTGGWTTWVNLNVTVTLNNNTSNTVRLESTGSDLGNVDQLTVP